jgi:hypothetical protein
MWHPSLGTMCRLLAAGALLGTAATADACLFPCFWGWGGFYAPPPVYAAPVYAPAPVFAPVPGPCGPGGCGTFYGPQACCDPCGAGGCASGNCGVSYAGDLTPQPDSGPRRARTYADPDNGASTSDVPEDDFSPTQRGSGESGTRTDPFNPPRTGEGSQSTEPPPPAQPMEEDAIPGAEPVLYTPVRQRTLARARYRLPHVARLHVAPLPNRDSPISQTRLVNR